jgi:Myb/SANT-like DNA-binding protein
MQPKTPKNATDTGNMKKEARCCWTDADDAILVQVLTQQKEAGNQSGAGWKSQVWTAVEAALTAEGIFKDSGWPENCGQMPGSLDHRLLLSFSFLNKLN